MRGKTTCFQYSISCGSATIIGLADAKKGAVVPDLGRVQRRHPQGADVISDWMAQAVICSNFCAHAVSESLKACKRHFRALVVVVVAAVVVVVVMTIDTTTT